MSHGFKNTIIGLLLLAGAFFYVLNDRQGGLVDDALRLCVFGEPEQTTVAAIGLGPAI